MTDGKPMKLLFICTHNRCRSILSEGIANHLARGEIQAHSAGSQPAGQVHPLSIKYLRARGISVDGLRSKSWNEFSETELDAVITVCDSAANETCPLWIDSRSERIPKIHWGLPDPSKLQGTEEEIEAAFAAVMNTIDRRIRRLLASDIHHLRGVDLKHALVAIARGN